MMCERDLRQSAPQAAADQSWHAGGMMRCAKRPAVGERATFDRAGDRRDHRDFEEFGRRQRRPPSIDGSRAASIVPARRGGPTIKRLWPPAAATSSARLALWLPLMFARSSCGPFAGRPTWAGGRDSTCVPLKWLASWISELDAMISISGAWPTPLLARMRRDTSSPRCAHWRPSPPSATPATGAIEPTRPSSPSTLRA